jgi:hypothetical protein
MLLFPTIIKIESVQLSVRFCYVNFFNYLFPSVAVHRLETIITERNILLSNTSLRSEMLTKSRLYIIKTKDQLYLKDGPIS